VAYNLIVSAKATTDVLDACIYYEAQQSGLSARFISALSAAYDKISQAPQHYSYISPERKNGLRDIKIKDFPYIVIFDINDNTVTIYAVFNTYQKPKF